MFYLLEVAEALDPHPPESKALSIVRDLVSHLRYVPDADYFSAQKKFAATRCRQHVYLFLSILQRIMSIPETALRYSILLFFIFYFSYIGRSFPPGRRMPVDHSRSPPFTVAVDRRLSKTAMFLQGYFFLYVPLPLPGHLSIMIGLMQTMLCPSRSAEWGRMPVDHSRSLSSTWLFTGRRWMLPSFGIVWAALRL